MRSRRRQNSVKRAGSISGNIHHRVYNAHSERCEGGAHVSKKVMNLLHLHDSLSAQASESIGGDFLDVVVLFQVTEQHTDHKTHDKQKMLKSKWHKWHFSIRKKTADICTVKLPNIRNACLNPL